MSSSVSSAPTASLVSAKPIDPPDDSPRVASTVESLRSLFDSGATKPLAWRQSALKALRAVLEASRDEIYEALYADLHKSQFESWLSEYNFVIDEIDESLAHLSDWSKPKRVNTNLLNLPAVSELHREPLGVVLNIVPFNYPLQLLVAPLIGALAAGNCMVLKPSELTPQTSAWAARRLQPAMQQFGVAVIEGGVPATQALLAQRWDLIFYTGSSRVARIVAKAAAEHLTPTILELGGKSPTLVLRDAQLQVAARRLVWGKLMNAGQTCVAPDYILVDARVHDRFVQLLRESVLEMYGADAKQSPEYGRIVNAAHTRRLAGLLRKLEEGVTAVTGGADQVDEADRFVPPTVLSGVKDEHEIMKEEIFGPILPVVRVDGANDEEVLQRMIRIVQSREKPLALYVFTESSAQADRVLSSVSSGGAVVNDCVLHLTNSALPFGGVGESGSGAYHGEKSFEAFSHTKSVLKRSAAPLADPPQRYPPYTQPKQAFMRRMLAIQKLARYKKFFYAIGAFAAAAVAAILITKFGAGLW